MWFIWLVTNFENAALVRLHFFCLLSLNLVTLSNEGSQQTVRQYKFVNFLYRSLVPRDEKRCVK